MKIKNFLLLGIQRIEEFKDLAGFTQQEFLDYMNEHNLWEMFNDPIYIMGSASESVEELVNDLGRYLEEDERNKIISRYHSEIRQGGFAAL